MSLRRFAPSRKQNLEKTEDRRVCGASHRPEDRTLRKQKTDEFAALRTVQKTEP
jgi:hypothetical protein